MKNFLIIIIFLKKLYNSHPYLLFFAIFLALWKLKKTPLRHHALFFGFSRRRLVLYRDCGSVKDSNFNGIFTASYWFRTSVFKSHTC